MRRALLFACALCTLASLDAAQEPARNRALKIASVGGAAGVDIEVLRTFARSQGLELEVMGDEAPEQALARLPDGQVHVVAGLVVTEGRREAADFTSEVMPSRLVVVNRKPAGSITFVEGLPGIKIGFVAGPPASEVLAGAKLPSSNQVSSASLAAVLEELKRGRTGAAVVNIEEALRAAAADGEIQTGVFLGPRQTLAYAVRKGNAALLGELNAYLRQLRASPSWSGVIARQAPGLLDALARARLEGLAAGH